MQCLATTRALGKGICASTESLAYRGIIKRAQSVGSVVPLDSFIISGRRWTCDFANAETTSGPSDRESRQGEIQQVKRQTRHRRCTLEYRASSEIMRITTNDCHLCLSDCSLSRVASPRVHSSSDRRPQDYRVSPLYSTAV